MWPRLALLALLLAALPAQAEDRPQGLLWNHSGLPATLPLQVKTAPGADYLLQLRDPETGTVLVVAYIRGGVPFRLLVPPGRYRLDFAFGRDWQGEAALFGPETGHITLEPPLDFAASADRRRGHLIDLTDPKAVTTQDFAICQRRGLAPDSLSLPLPPPAPGPLKPRPQRPRPWHAPGFPTLDYDLTSRICD